MQDPEQIRGWIAQAEAEVSHLAGEAEQIQARLAEARRQLMLLYELLATVTNAPVAVSSEELRIGRSIREQVQANAETILREHGRPMRIQDLHAFFVRRGMPLPGRGTPTNIVAHLVVSDTFSRPARGVYALAEWEGASGRTGTKRTKKETRRPKPAKRTQRLQQPQRTRQALEG